MPWLSRENYRRELLSVFFFSVLLAAVEGGVLAVIVKNAFEGVVPGRRLNFVVALIGAAPEFANITSFFWAALAHGRAKVRFINALQVATVAMVGAIALAPRTEAGLFMLALALVLARVCMSGVLTLRATVWRANYPRSDRARVTGKLATVQVITVAAAGFALGQGMDRSEDSFRLLLPVACLFGLVGAWAYGRIRMRHHERLVRAERALASEGGQRPDRPSLNPVSLLRVLAGDRHYAAFMASMFVFGAGNLMLTAPLVITLRERFGLEYLGGILITHTIPYLVMPLAIPLWARLLDRTHIVRFRSIHSWAFVLSQALFLVAAQTHTFWLLHVAAVVQGVAYAGGTLAWNLGHLDFAPPHRASQYMGVHVTLNGVRGLLAPFVAVGAYEWLEAREVGSGVRVFALSVGVCVIGALGFVVLGRAMGEKVRVVPREG